MVKVSRAEMVFNSSSFMSFFRVLNILAKSGVSCCHVGGGGDGSSRMRDGTG